MANEAINLEAPRIVKRYTVLDSVGIAKGTILRLSAGDLYADASSADGDVFAGVAIEEKTANDGITSIGAAVDGVWDIKCNAGVGIALGAMVCLSGANLIRTVVEADFPLGRPFGKALEAASVSEVIRVRLGLN